MNRKLKLPAGIENFEEIRTAGFYYVDKTGLIRDLLNNLGKANLFTRPRRFGKTLNMSMLQYFFEAGSDSTLFDGLEISKEKALCDEYMGKFPVICISLKGVSGRNFDEAKDMLRMLIGTEALRFQVLMKSDNLSDTERKQYLSLIHLSDKGTFDMEDALLRGSLSILSQLLKKHYGRNVIILIDEYDVPLDRAYQSKYYDEMVEFIKVLFGQVLKTNNSLQFAVLTGCLRISKESIFTGLNNFNVYTIKDALYNEYFGFTDDEVTSMLEYYGFMEKYDTIKKWYDGYQFGSVDIYCPWDVVNYCHALKMNMSIKPQNYWINTSSNNIVRQFIGMAKQNTRNEIELLIEGGSITKKIRQELTYRDLESNIDNLWSILFTTGYLTQCSKTNDSMTKLVIPNEEVRTIFVEQVQEWFKAETTKDNQNLESFCRAFEENNVTAIEEGFTSYLKKTISIRDTHTKNNMKENFYHGILLGLFGNMDEWSVQSNAETGDGYSDIAIEILDKDIGIIIELKYAENAQFDAACRKALKQIEDRNYDELLIDDGMKTIYKYGIACYKKRCKVVTV
jgi:hypothetical protein